MIDNASRECRPGITSKSGTNRQSEIKPNILLRLTTTAVEAHVFYLIYKNSPTLV